MSTTTSPPTQTQKPPFSSSSIHTYHCLCATLLLCTPYSIPHLPTRAAPSRDKARILPLPPIQPSSQKRRSSPKLPPPPLPLISSAAKIKEPSGTATVSATAEEQDDKDDENENDEEAGEGEDGEEEDPGGGDGGGGEDNERGHENRYLPSLILPALRPARKIIIVRREDGWERRRVWRCARCGLGVGYEVEEEGGVGGEEKDKKLRVMFLLEGGLVETGDWEGVGGNMEKEGELVEGEKFEGAS